MSFALYHYLRHILTCAYLPFIFIPNSIEQLLLAEKIPYSQDYLLLSYHCYRKRIYLYPNQDHQTTLSSTCQDHLIALPITTYITLLTLMSQSVNTSGIYNWWYFDTLPIISHSTKIVLITKFDKNFAATQ